MGFAIINLPRVYPRRPDYQKSKRMIDLILCIVLSPLIIPAVILCALAVYLDSGKPIVFMQERIGKGGKSFRIYKFRTLKANFDGSQFQPFMRAYIRGDIGNDTIDNGTYKPMSEKYISRVGNFLRRTSLDELPQLINVLKGEMSIVGPRPNVPWEVEEYWPWHYERLEVLPGMTGLAQVNGRSCISFNSIVRFDINYIENQGLQLDLKIIWQTIGSVILSRSAG